MERRHIPTDKVGQGIKRWSRKRLGRSSAALKSNYLRTREVRDDETDGRSLEPGTCAVLCLTPLCAQGPRISSELASVYQNTQEHVSNRNTCGTWLHTKTWKPEGKSERLYLNVQNTRPRQTELSRVKKTPTLFKCPVPKVTAYALSHLQVVKIEEAHFPERWAEEKYPRVVSSPGRGVGALQRSFQVTSSTCCPRDRPHMGAKCLKGG